MRCCQAAHFVVPENFEAGVPVAGGGAARKRRGWWSGAGDSGCGWRECRVPGCRAVGLSGCRGVGLSGCRAVGLSGCRGVGVSGCRSVKFKTPVCHIVRVPGCRATPLLCCIYMAHWSEGIVAHARSRPAWHAPRDACRPLGPATCLPASLPPCYRPPATLPPLYLPPAPMISAPAP